MKGRPTDFTPELADTICEQLALGRSMRSICLEEEMPAMQTIWRWLREKEDFSEQYARAKQESADAMSEELLEIADNPSNEDVNRDRLRVDARKWLMSKMKPKKYGDKMDVTSDGKAITVSFDSSFKNGTTHKSKTDSQ